MDRSGFEEDGKTFVAVHNPPLRMAVVGGVHIAQALVPIAKIAGFDPIVIDPREGFGSPARFPGAQIINEWPDEALAELGKDHRTALVLLTHDPKLDDPALEFALKSDYFYIGALGSKRTHAQRVDGFKKTDFQRPKSRGFTVLLVEYWRSNTFGDCCVYSGRDGAKSEVGWMIFAEVTLEEAEGAILAHSISCSGERLKKVPFLGRSILSLRAGEQNGSQLPALLRMILMKMLPLIFWQMLCWIMNGKD